jgi:hypothetical protein
VGLGWENPTTIQNTTAIPLGKQWLIAHPTKPVLITQIGKHAIYCPNEIGNLRLRQLGIGAQAFALAAHLLINQGREDDNRDILRDRVGLDELRQAVTVHNRHLDVGDDALDMLV